MKTSSLFSLLLFCCNYVSLLTYSQSIEKIESYGFSLGEWRNIKVTVDNCDNNSILNYNLDDQINLQQTLSLTSGWKILPGLTVGVPDIGNINLGAELARTYNSNVNIEQQAKQQLEQKVLPHSKMEYTVSFRETVATGSITVTDDAFFFSKSATSDFIYITDREIQIKSSNTGCFDGTYDFIAWDEVPGRQGIGYVLFYPQRNHIQGGELIIDGSGNVFWYLWINHPNIPPIKLECRGTLDTSSKYINNPHITFNFGNVVDDIDYKYREELSYAFCGYGLSPRTGAFEYDKFNVSMPVEYQEILLVMSNSQGTFRWRKR